MNNVDSASKSFFSHWITLHWLSTNKLISHRILPNAAAETNRTQGIDDAIERMRLAQIDLKGRLSASELDDPVLNEARDLDLTKWSYGKAKEEGEADGEEEEN